MTKEVALSGCRVFGKYFPGFSWGALVLAYALI